MNLNHLISGKNQKQSNLIHLERYVNDPKGDFKDHSTVNVRYSPESGDEIFSIPYTWLNKEDAIILTDAPSLKLTEHIIKEDKILFCGHPECDKYLPKIDGMISVAPTASTRTMLTLGFNNNFFIKTDLDKLHFKFIRRLKATSVRHSIDINHDLRKFCLSEKCSFFSIFPESIGVIYGDYSHGTGVVYRELDPYPLIGEEKQLIPYFSLYSKDLKNVSDLPLMIQILELHNSNDKLATFLETMIHPLLKSWYDIVFERGLLMELHGQNTLIEIDSTGHLGRIVSRDFQSVYSDQRIRKSNGLLPFSKHIIGDEDGILANEQYSHVYDNMIGNLLFKRMANSFADYYRNYEYRIVCQGIASLFQEISKGNMKDLFPKTVYVFPKGQLDDNHVRFVDSGELPLFR